MVLVRYASQRLGFRAAPNPLQLLFQDTRFGIQLGRVIHMLVVAAAAGREMRASGNHPIWRWLQHLHQGCCRMARLFLHQSHLHQLTRDGIWHENHPTVWQSSDSIAAIRRVVDTNIECVGHNLTKPINIMHSWIRHLGVFISRKLIKTISLLEN